MVKAIEMKNTFSLVITIVFCCQISITHAQYTDVINSNRPGSSQSAFSVGTKVLQFELGSYLVKEKRNVKLKRIKIYCSRNMVFSSIITNKNLEN